MNVINEQLTPVQPHGRGRRQPWGRYTILASLALIAVTVFLLNGQALPQVAALEQQATGTDVAAQPRGTPPAGTPTFPNREAPGATMTTTLETSGVTTDVVTAATEATPTATPQPTRIVAVAGSAGAVIFALDGDEVIYTAPVGSKLRLSGRTADNAWLMVELDAGRGWVARQDVIAFNLDRLNVVTATPPTGVESAIRKTESATPSATVGAATIITDITENVTEGVMREVAIPEETVATSASAADVATSTAEATQRIDTITARLDTDKARALNIRSGPGAEYARVGAIDAEETLVVTGRNAAGDWLAVELPDATTGWAAAYYLLVTGDVTTLPEIQVSAAEEAATETTPSTTTTPTESPTPAASAAAAPVQRTQTTGLEGLLAFQTGQGGTIYAYDLATGELWPLTTGFDPAVSPDGATVAFTRVGNDAGLYLIDIDGGNERRIYSGPGVIASPKWSTDGAQILFSYATAEMQCRDMGSGRCVTDDQFETGRYRDLDINDYRSITLYTYDIGVVDADGGDFHSLSALHTARAPDWSSAGIVYQSSDGIQVMSTQGGDSHVILFDPLTQVDQDPDWAGERIVFQRPGASHWEIWTADADGANITALTQPQTVLVEQLPSNVAPAYSPDGKHIVFLSNRTASGEAGAWRIWVMDADGSNQRALPIEVAINYTFGAEQVVSWGG